MNKEQWLAEFERLNGRPATEQEIAMASQAGLFQEVTPQVMPLASGQMPYPQAQVSTPRAGMSKTSKMILFIVLGVFALFLVLGVAAVSIGSSLRGLQTETPLSYSYQVELEGAWELYRIDYYEDGELTDDANGLEDQYVVIEGNKAILLEKDSGKWINKGVLYVNEEQQSLSFYDYVIDEDGYLNLTVYEDGEIREVLILEKLAGSNAERVKEKAQVMTPKGFDEDE